MTAIDTLTKELNRVQAAQAEIITEHGIVPAFYRYRYKMLVQQAAELKGSLDYLKELYQR
jgi:hypothetical protein